VPNIVPNLFRISVFEINSKLIRRPQDMVCLVEYFFLLAWSSGTADRALRQSSWKVASQVGRHRWKVSTHVARVPRVSICLDVFQLHRGQIYPECRSPKTSTHCGGRRCTLPPAPLTRFYFLIGSLCYLLSLLFS